MLEPGLYIICCAGGYYPYVRIGWCTRNDDEIQIQNCRVIKRFGTEAELAKIAEEGPKENTTLLSIAKVEFTAAALVARRIPCNDKKWKKEVPKPENWVAAVV